MSQKNAEKASSVGKKGETAAKSAEDEEVLVFDVKNVEQAKGAVVTIAQLAKLHQKSIIKLHKMGQQDVTQLMNFVASCGYKILINGKHVVTLKCNVTKKSDAVKGMVLGGA